MSANVPESLDAWRMVVARRRFDGQVSLAELTRLQGLVADTDGECSYSLEFGRDEVLRVSYVELTIDTALPLTCQRSMQRFLLPVKVTQRLGLIRDEDEESSLPEEYEALLVPEDGQLRPLDLVEDELVLAVPVLLQYVLSGNEYMEQRLGFDYPRVIGLGLLLALLTGVGSWVLGYPYMTSHTDYVAVPLLGKLPMASAMAFDIGVYLVVAAGTLLMLAMMGGVRRPQHGRRG